MAFRIQQACKLSTSLMKVLLVSFVFPLVFQLNYEGVAYQLVKHSYQIPITLPSRFRNLDGKAILDPRGRSATRRTDVPEFSRMVIWIVVPLEEPSQTWTID